MLPGNFGQAWSLLTCSDTENFLLSHHFKTTVALFSKSLLHCYENLLRLLRTCNAERTLLKEGYNTGLRSG